MRDRFVARQFNNAGNISAGRNRFLAHREILARGLRGSGLPRVFILRRKT
jgi:hypothetical protein